MSVLALDIETKNMSHEIGGFGNTHMFQVSTVATWDGSTGTVYVDEPVYCIHKYINAKQYIDTSKDLLKGHGERFQLKNLVKCTMDDSKLMDSADAPKLWKMGRYDEVVEYCMKDTQLVYNLWGYGKENGIVKAFSIEKEKFIDLGVDW